MPNCQLIGYHFSPLGHLWTVLHIPWAWKFRICSRHANSPIPLIGRESWFSAAAIISIWTGSFRTVRVIHLQFWWTLAWMLINGVEWTKKEHCSPPKWYILHKKLNAISGVWSSPISSSILLESTKPLLRSLLGVALSGSGGRWSTHCSWTTKLWLFRCPCWVGYICLTGWSSKLFYKSGSLFEDAQALSCTYDRECVSVKRCTPLERQKRNIKNEKWKMGALNASWPGERKWKGGESERQIISCDAFGLQDCSVHTAAVLWPLLRLQSSGELFCSCGITARVIRLLKRLSMIKA